MSINYWTPEEDKLLKELYQTDMTVEEIAKRLGRTEQAVKKRVSKTGIKRYSTSYHGCTEDCFNCPYPDCMKQGGLDDTDYSGRDIVCGRFLTDGMHPDDYCSYGERMADNA